MSSHPAVRAAHRGEKKETKMFWTKIVPKDETGRAQLRQNFDMVEIPDAQIFLASVTNILATALGFKTSSERQSCVLGDGRNIPMMSYSLIEYLLGLDLSGFDVLELGGGGSTKFWASLTKSVVTLETNSEWVNILRRDCPANVDARATTPERLVADMLAIGRSFDAIIVDPAANRLHSAKAALRILKPGGFVILDNSDWHPNAARALRDGDLIQVDFHDFRPLHHFRCTASIFLHPQFRPKPNSARLPLVPIGGKDMAAVNTWDSAE